MSANALMQPADGTTCKFTAFAGPWERVTHIGEVHVADLFGMTEDFKYGTNADSSVSVGFSTGGAGGPWSFDGSVQISNSIGTNSGFTVGNATSNWVDSHMYYSEYEDNAAAGCPGGAVTGWKVQDESDAGDSWEDTGTTQPLRNPYGGCAGNDPYGYATIQAKTGFFNSDKSHAEQIFAAATAFGFGFQAQSGFSTDLYDQYNNTTSGDQQLCGGAQMPNVPILYNNTW